jgi:hypothetical protein
MNTTEHLEKIKAKCQDKIKSVEMEIGSLAPIFHAALNQSVAGWKTTIAAIELVEWGYNQKLEQQIISAWPEGIL